MQLQTETHQERWRFEFSSCLSPLARHTQEEPKSATVSGKYNKMVKMYALRELSLLRELFSQVKNGSNGLKTYESVERVQSKSTGKWRNKLYEYICPTWP